MTFPIVVLTGLSVLAQPAMESLQHSNDAAIAGMCEALDEKRPSTEEDRRATRKLIVKAARSKGADDSIFRLWAVRESHYRPFKRHRMPGDAWAAAQSWFRVASMYGWKAEWTPGKKKVAENARMTAISDQANTSYPDFDRWGRTGLGLYGLNPALHLWRWDPTAPPEVLCDAVISTEIVRRLACRAVKVYGAENWIEVNQVYGAGKIKPRPKMDAKFIARAKKAGVDPYAKPDLGRCAMGPVDGQEEWAASIRGGPMVAAQVEPEATPPGGPATTTPTPH